MDKKGTDADVIFNRASVALAKSQRLIASWLPPKSEEERAKEKTEEELEKEEKEIFTPIPELLGVGAPIPKDVNDSVLKRRELSSNDKLLQQLIGKKVAKAHIASKQIAAKQNAPGSKPGTAPRKSVPRQDSEDEEEGRASAFKSKSKKRKLGATTATPVDDGAEGPSHLEIESLDSRAELQVAQDPLSKTAADQKRTKLSRQDDSSDDNSRSKPKPKAGSYLDEILAARSKKKKKKMSTA